MVKRPSLIPISATYVPVRISAIEIAAPNQISPFPNTADFFIVFSFLIWITEKSAAMKNELRKHNSF